MSIKKLILAISVLISYSQILKMYFWHDDYTILYYLQRGEFVWWPFHSLYILQKLFFSLFGLEPKGYFLVLIAMYILASWLLYYFAELLFKRKFIAFSIALVFSAGYIGQESMQSFFGFGFENLFGLNLFLAILIFLLNYARRKRLRWLILAIASFYFMMEFTIHRYVGIIVAVVASDLLFTFSEKRAKFNGFLTRTLIFSSIFITQLVVRPLYHLLGVLGVSWAPHGVAYTQNISEITSLGRLTEIIHPESLSNLIGSFWNLFLPSIQQGQLYFYLIRNLPHPINQFWFWLSAAPLLTFILVTVITIFFIRKDLKVAKMTIFTLIIFVFFIFGWGQLILFFGGYPIDQISRFNGGIILAFLFIIYLWNIPAFKRLALFSITLIFAVLIPFFVFSPNQILPSYHNYLFSSSVTLGFILSFFVSKELIDKSSVKLRKWSLFLFLFPVFVLTFSHLSAAIVSQKVLIDNEIKYAKSFYRSLTDKLPVINSRTIIYLEGETKEMGEVSGNLQRVGAMGSEAVFAVHYNTEMENIFLPTDTSEIKKILESHPDMSVNDVYSFVFDGQNLTDISSGLRSSLTQDKRDILMPPNVWKISPGLEANTEYFNFLNYTFGVYPQIIITPKQKVSTQLPLKVKIKLKAILDGELKAPYYHLFQRPEYPDRKLWQEILSWEIGQCEAGNLKGKFECVVDEKTLSSALTNKEGKINISWEYNTYGPIARNKFVELDIILDGKWHEYEFNIHNGGMHLKNFTVNYVSFPGTLEFGGIIFTTGND